MNALVTGCAGFIGSHLIDRLLTEGYEVTGIDCFTDYYPRKIKESNIRDALQHKNFTLLERDILEMSSYPDVDVVFHEAAQAGVRASWGSSFSIYTRNNIEATQRLLEYYKNKSLKKFVYASSSSVYGDAPLPMREDMRPDRFLPTVFQNLLPSTSVTSTGKILVCRQYPLDISQCTAHGRDRIWESINLSPRYWEIFH